MTAEQKKLLEDASEWISLTPDGEIKYESLWEKKSIDAGIDMRRLHSCIEGNISYDEFADADCIEWYGVIQDYSELTAVEEQP